MLAFFIGVEVNANAAVDRCVAMIDIEELQKTAQLIGQDEVNFLCTNMTAFINCIDEVFEEETGFTIKQMASFMRGTDLGRALNLLSNLQTFLEDFCSAGSQLREDYLEHTECFQGITADKKEACAEDAKTAYNTYSNEKNEIFQNKAEETCMVSAYTIGCLGATIHEECGEDAFKLYIDIVKKFNPFRNGLCTDAALQNMKNSFADSLDMESSRKDLFQLAFNIRKRRK